MLLFNRIIGSIQSLHVIWTVSQFMPCVWLQVSRRCPWRCPCNFQVRTASSCATVWTGLWKRPKAIQCLEASALQLSGWPRYAVRTLGQATPSFTRIWISKDTIRKDSAKRPDNVATLPNATHCSKIFWVSFTDAKRSDSIDRPDARSSRPDAVLFWKEYHYFGKTVAENRSDVVKWPSERYSPESDFDQN
jgi:hypothetical protein